MAPTKALAQNVRPRSQEEDDYDSFEDGVDIQSEDESTEEDEESAPDKISASRQRAKDNGDSEDEPGEEGEDVQDQISRTSFGALKQAHEALGKKRKRGSDTNEDQEEKLAALRSRLKDLRERTASQKDAANKPRPELSPTQHAEHVDDGSDTDSAPSEIEAPSKSRTSKHAPAAQSSKYQVTRKRTVIDVPKRSYRDPRFDAFHGQPSNDNSEKAYAFLDDYQRDEIKELRKAVKATKSEEERETLRRKMVSMENKLKSRAARERERDVVRKHRREEREKIEQGKQPFYLKQKDIKQKALEEKFNSMKGKDREKLLERRRKKEGQKEKKRMPMDRRVER